MSRIGKKPVPVPAKVNVTIADRHITVEGPKGKLEHTFPFGVSIEKQDKDLVVARVSDSKQHRAFHGMTRALLANMVLGVETPFVKTVEIHGTGFGANVSGRELEMELGFSNKIKVEIPEGLELKVDKGRPVVMHISGCDKQAVGQFAAVLRSKRPPSPYSDNKGVRYRGEVIRKRAGKAFGDKK